MHIGAFNLFPATSSVVGVVIYTFPLFLLSFVWILRRVSRNTNQLAPEVGGAWPGIGHLHLLGGSQPLHITLSDMADKYGPIFTIKIGMRRTLVVSNSAIVKECLTTNDKTFASRPKIAATKHMGYNNVMVGFAPYGPRWRQMRKLATKLLSNNRIDTLKHVQESEFKLSLQELYQQWNKGKISSDDHHKVLVQMERWFWNLSLNLILRMVVGKRFSYPSGNINDTDQPERLKKALKDFAELGGKFVLSDALPFLEWLDIGGEVREMKKVGKELDLFAEGWLQERKRKKASGELKDGEDFMSVMLSIFTDGGEHDADTINKATCLALILAAEDTTATTLTWALSLLLNNQDALKKVKDELDIHVGKNRLVNQSDTKNLVYLQAVIKETLRLYPPAPLSLIHSAIEDCVVSGYRVPEGTWLITNLYKIHRDPSIWADPCEFRPERFLTTHSHVDVRGQNFEFIPFSSGRRMCPGISFALQVLQPTLANLLQWFEVASPGDEPIDMQQGVALTLAKSNPLQVLITPRLPSFLYESMS